MVIKTDLCSYSQWKIYPGHGQRVVDKDGRSSLYLYKRSRIFALRSTHINPEKSKHKNLGGPQPGEGSTEKHKRMMQEKRKRRESSRGREPFKELLSTPLKK